jgi:hypothetical protein
MELDLSVRGKNTEFRVLGFRVLGVRVLGSGSRGYG